MESNIESLKLAFTLFAVFQVKHFVADFPLQSRYMLQKTRSDWAFLPPLALHSAIHAALTLAIVMSFSASLWWLAVFDFVVHFTMDRIKSGPRYLGRFNDTKQNAFWIAMGFDQMVHHFTHMAIIWVILLSL